MAFDLPPPVTPPTQHPEIVLVEEARPIWVKSHGYRYRVDGNTLMSPARIKHVLKEAPGPKAALEKLARSYHDAGFFMVALNPRLTDKTVSIEVVEGMISEAKIAKDLSWFYRGLDFRSDLKDSEIIRRNVLAEAYSGRQGERPKLSFEPGTLHGGSRMTVQTEDIPDSKPWNAGVTFGNYGNRFSSRYVAGQNVSFRPGKGIQFTADINEGIPDLAADSKGSQYLGGGFAVSSVTPWGIYDFGYRRTHYERPITGANGASFRLKGDIEYWTLGGTYLAYADATTRWALSGSYNHTDQIQTVNLGPQGDYTLLDQRYSFFNLGTTFNKSFSIFDEPGNANLDLHYLQGFSERRGTLQPKALGVPDPKFTYFRANSAYTQTLPWGFKSQWQVNTQWSLDTLPQNQEWFLGGYGNLTAYFPAVLVGDSGYWTRLDFMTPTGSQWGFNVNGSVFLEAGGSQYHYRAPGNPNWQFLSDVGLGISVNHSFGTSAEVAYAFPIARSHVDNAVLEQGRADVYFILRQYF